MLANGCLMCLLCGWLSEMLAFETEMLIRDSQDESRRTEVRRHEQLVPCKLRENHLGKERLTIAKPF